MATAKRLYLYLVSGVGLGLLLAATSILAGLLLDRFGLGSTATISGPASDHASRESLSLAIGFIVVGLPLWLIHWALVERMVAGDGPAAGVERQSIVRAVYFGIVLVWLIALAAASGADLLREAICRPLGAMDPYYSPSISGSAAWLVVALGAFLYHAWIRARDIRQGPPITGAAAWVSRLALYGFAYAAMTVVLVEFGTVISTVVQALTGYMGLAPISYAVSGSGPLVSNQSAAAAWWVRPVVGATASALLYGAAWLGHWLYASRIATRDDRQGVDERASRVRLTYFVLVVAAAVGYAVAGFGAALSIPLRVVFGSWHSAMGQSNWGEALVPLLAIVPLLAAWAWHRGRAAREWLWQSGSPLRAIRPMDYLTSLVGLAAFAYALAWFLGALTQNVTGTDYGPGYSVDSVDHWRTSAAQTIGVMVAAAPIWLWPWLAGQRRRRIDVLGEARSTSRRAFLFAVGGATVLTCASSAAFIVYRTTRVGVGLEGTSLGSDLRLPLCALIVAVPLLAYHGFWIRRDLAVARDAVEPAPAATPAEEAAPQLAPAHVQASAATSPSQELVIVGPAGADLETLRASVAEKLPDGYTITVRSSGDAART